MDDRQTVIEWVSALVKDLVDKPESLTFKAVVDAKGLLITVYAPREELGRLIGKQGRVAESLRAIVSTFGAKHGARASLKIENSAS